MPNDRQWSELRAVHSALRDSSTPYLAAGRFPPSKAPDLAQRRHTIRPCRCVRFYLECLFALILGRVPVEPVYRLILCTSRGRVAMLQWQKRHRNPATGRAQDQRADYDGDEPTMRRLIHYDEST